MNYQSIANDPAWKPFIDHEAVDRDARTRSPRWLKILKIINGALLIYPVGYFALMATWFSLFVTGNLLTGAFSWASAGYSLFFFGGAAGVAGVFRFMNGKSGMTTTVLLTWGTASYGLICVIGFLDPSMNESPLMIVTKATPLVVGIVDVLTNVFLPREPELV